MSELDDVLTDLDTLGDVLPADAGFDDPEVVEPVVPSAALAEVSTTEVWTTEVWWQFDFAETDIAGSSIVLPNPFQPASAFSAGAAVAGWRQRRRARRATAPRDPAA